MKVSLMFQAYLRLQWLLSWILQLRISSIHLYGPSYFIASNLCPIFLSTYTWQQGATKVSVWFKHIWECRTKSVKVHTFFLNETFPYHIMRLIDVVNVAFALINIFKRRPFRMRPKIPTSDWTAHAWVSLCFGIPPVNLSFGSTTDIFSLPEHRKSKRKKIIIFKVILFISYQIMMENWSDVLFLYQKFCGKKICFDIKEKWLFSLDFEVFLYSQLSCSWIV